MKKILTLILILIVTVQLVAQTDTSYVVTFNIEPIRVQTTILKLMPIKLRKVTRSKLDLKMSAVYLPESDVSGSKGDILIYQIPVGTITTQAQLDSITKYIKKITENIETPDIENDLIFHVDNIVQEINKYTGQWTHAANSSWNNSHYNKTISYTSVVGSSLEVTFTGYRFKWYSEKRMNHGIAGLSIDGGPEIKIDLYEKREDNNSTLVYSSPILSNGQHTIKLRMIGEKNPAWSTDYPEGSPHRASAQEDNIMHDKFITYRKQ